MRSLAPEASTNCCVTVVAAAVTVGMSDEEAGSGADVGGAWARRSLRLTTQENDGLCGKFGVDRPLAAR